LMLVTSGASFFAYCPGRAWWGELRHSNRRAAALNDSRRMHRKLQQGSIDGATARNCL
jgi:hypothetical protein